MLRRCWLKLTRVDEASASSSSWRPSKVSKEPPPPPMAPASGMRRRDDVAVRIDLGRGRRRPGLVEPPRTSYSFRAPPAGEGGGELPYPRTEPGCAGSRGCLRLMGACPRSCAAELVKRKGRT